jgi:hypothetical protein
MLRIIITEDTPFMGKILEKGDIVYIENICKKLNEKVETPDNPYYFLNRCTDVIKPSTLNTKNINYFKNLIYQFQCKDGGNVNIFNILNKDTYEDTSLLKDISGKDIFFVDTESGDEDTVEVYTGIFKLCEGLTEDEILKKLDNIVNLIKKRDRFIKNSED